MNEATRIAVNEATRIVEAAGKLLPELSARADETEAQRQVPQDLAEALARAGLYRMWVPKDIGGLEIPLPASLRALEIMARGNASASWCVAIGITSSLALPALPAESARRIFSTPETIMAGVYAPTGKAVRDGDGFRVNGQWAFGSGSRNASWILAGCRFGEETPARTAMVVVPTSEVVLLDTWHVSGLRGTGSTDFRLSDVWVPEDRISGWTKLSPPEGPLYRIPQLTLLAVGFGAIALGMGRAALDDFCALAETKRGVGASRPLKERREVQDRVARAEATLRSARSYYYESADSLWESASAGREVSLDERADLRLATCHAIERAAEAIGEVYHLGGGSSIYESSRLQRYFRDIHVMTQHVQVRPELYAVIGSQLLGAARGTEML